MSKDYLANFTPIEFLVVEELPDVTNKIYLVRKEKPIMDGTETVDVYEEWIFVKKLIGYIEPEDEVEE